MFLKTCGMESAKFSWNEWRVWGVLCKSQYLFEKLQTSLTVKNSENRIKCGCSRRTLQ